jgi:MFS family permease
MTTTAPDTVLAPELPRRYGFSSLLTGLGRMWRGWAVVLPVVLINALVQALLVKGDPVATTDPAFLLLALLSFLALAAAYAFVASAALDSVDGKVTWGSVGARVGRRLVPYLIWLVVLIAVLGVGLALNVIPGILVAVLTPYLLLAALDGHGNAIGANVSAIGSRLGRWLVTALLMVVIVAVGWLVAGLVSFFVGGLVGAVVVWVGFGLLASWLLTTWASIFRSTRVGARSALGQRETPGAAPDPDAAPAAGPAAG